MEWHFGGDIKDQETPEYFLQQGLYKLENCGLPNKYCIQEKETAMNELSFNRKSFIHEPNKERTHGWTTCGGFPFADWRGENEEASSQRNGPLGDRMMDFQLDGLNETNRMDDIFLRSMLEEDPLDMKNPYQTVGIVPESECSTVSFDNFSTEMITESQSILMEPTDMDVMDYFGNCDFSQSEVPILTVKTTDELDTSHEEAEPVEKEISLEARVLRELEIVMTKIPQNTRICFRDALYRLAKCSKQNHFLTNGQSEEISMDIPPTIHHETPRSGRGQPMELETNAIDRTIANLMFNTLNCNQTDLSFTSLNLSDEAVTEENSHGHGMKTSKIVPYRSTALPHDAEVPIFGVCI